MVSQIITFMIKILLPLWLVVYYIYSWFLLIKFMVGITFMADFYYIYG